MKSRPVFRVSICLATLFFVGLCVLSSPSHADLIGWWKLDEGAGDTVADSSPSGTTGQITNADTGGLGDTGSVWVNDPVRGTVLGVGGGAEGAFVRAGDIPLMTLDNDFTWAFWANQDAGNTTPNNIIVGNRKDANAVDFDPRQFIKFTPTKFEWHMNGNGDDNLAYDADIPADVWMHHAVVKDGGSLTYYRDGVEASAGVFTQAMGFAQPLFLGGDNEGASGENWRGMLSDVRTYDHALSASDVAALVPEPSSIVLALAGLLALVGLARPARRKS